MRKFESKSFFRSSDIAKIVFIKKSWIIKLFQCVYIWSVVLRWWHMNERLYDVIANQSLQSRSTRPILARITRKLLPVQVKRRLATWTSREQNNQLTNRISSWQLCQQKIYNGTAMIRLWANIKNARWLARSEDISNDKLKSFLSILLSNSQTNNYKSNEL